MTAIQLGLEACLSDPPTVIANGRLGLLMNQASVDAEFRYACDLFADRFPNRLAAIFSPQHGLWGEQQANMIESSHGVYEPLQLPIYSLYSDRREPTEAMLAGLDALVVDLQDVGTRVYTFIWTVSYCLEACARAGIPVIVLDRPNPLGGETIEGPLLEPGFESFVGRTHLPMRHGLTIGELSRLVAKDLRLDVDLTVVPMRGWRREMLYPETERLWTIPSPNMPRQVTAILYPGQVLLEGTNLSEGRGTTLPFEMIGAPFIDPHKLLCELDCEQFPGLKLRPVRFVPTFDKWQGQSCGGVAFHVVEAGEVRSFRSTLCTIAAIKRLWPSEFRWLPPPYEYEYQKMPIDILYGSSRLRETMACEPLTAESLSALAEVDSPSWRTRTASVQLYH